VIVEFRILHGSIARSLNVLTPGIAEVLQGSKTRDPDAELTAEIDGLISLASTAKAPSDLLEMLRSLRGAVGTQWDTSFDCSLDWARGQVQGMAPVTNAAEQGICPPNHTLTDPVTTGVIGHDARKVATCLS
jgi:hypothetical protein